MSAADRAGSRPGRFVDVPKNKFGYFGGYEILEVSAECVVQGIRKELRHE